MFMVSMSFSILLSRITVCELLIFVTGRMIFVITNMKYPYNLLKHKPLGKKIILWVKHEIRLLCRFVFEFPFSLFVFSLSGL